MIKKFFNKKTSNKILASMLAVFIIMLFIIPAVSLAQDPSGDLGTDPSPNPNPAPTTTTKVINPIKIDTVNGFIKTVLEGIIKIGIPVIAIALVYSGYLFVEAMGDPGKLKKAKDAFVYCFIGAAILLGSWALAQMISDTVLQIK
ncbi:MAG TPA: pilin [Candidatus Paceibacterota bacterium]